MRHLLSIFLIIVFAGSAWATDLGAVRQDTKDNSHIGRNPGTPDGREGGEDMETAFVIDSLPFDDTGNTSDNIDDYDVTCPTGAPNSPDVVYSYTPTMDETIRVDLCGSGYDTKTYIVDIDHNIIACNDDYYFDDVCGVYASLIEYADLNTGTEYFIFVDGYGSDSGDYVLNIRISDPPPPWILICDGLEEGEPTLGPYYHDAFNGGCNSPEYGNPFSDLTQAGDTDGELIYCGVSGWLGYPSTNRDTDWMYFMIGETGTIEWTLEAEYETNGFLLGGDCDAGITILDQITYNYVNPANMIIQGSPGDVVMLWVGPSFQTGPPNGDGFDYNYRCTFTGLYSGGPVPTTSISFDAVKSLYR